MVLKISSFVEFKKSEKFNDILNKEDRYDGKFKNGLSKLSLMFINITFVNEIIPGATGWLQHTHCKCS